MPVDKPFFQCPVEVKRLPDGTIEFRITVRDGSVHVIPGPPGAVFDTLPGAVSACQLEGSDDVTIGGPSPVTHRP